MNAYTATGIQARTLSDKRALRLLRFVIVIPIAVLPINAIDREGDFGRKGDKESRLHQPAPPL